MSKNIVDGVTYDDGTFDDGGDADGDDRDAYGLFADFFAIVADATSGMDASIGELDGFIDSRDG